MSQTLKTSKSGPLTRAARPRRVTKSNMIIPIVG
jgi:hypothetical protein